MYYQPAEVVLKRDGKRAVERTILTNIRPSGSGPA